MEGKFMFSSGVKDGIIAIMAAYLPNFEHIETGKGLDSKM